jgi:hypothetical protein
MLRDVLKRYFLMRGAITEADQRAASLGRLGSADSHMARNLRGAAESLDDAAERHLGAILLLRHSLIFAARGLGLRRQVIEDTSDVSATWSSVSALAEVSSVWLALSDPMRTRVEGLVLQGITAEYDGWSASELRSLRATLLRVVRHMTDALEDDILAPKRIRVRRIGRWLTVTFVLCLASGWGFHEYRESRVSGNMALKRSVSISSTWRADLYPPDRVVDGDTTQVGCHTENQVEPWLSIDLGRTRRVHRVVVTNRLDGQQERAIPLRIETSIDGKAFTEYARRDAVFDTWTATRSTVKARYVRLTVLGQSILHLNEVEIY